MSGSPMIPVPARVLARRRESAEVVSLTLETKARPNACLPGQFNMVYAFGVGEVPMSVSGDPARCDVVVHTVHAVGAATRALCRVAPGDVLGLRGPYGTPWPVERARGSDLVLIAGGLGLAPLRPVIYHVLAHRADYGRVSLLVGARTPADLVFRRELARWLRSADLDLVITVDRAPGDWRGRVGVVTALLPAVGLDAERTLAFVCGPEVMMRFAVRELGRRGIPDERIYVSMERNMKCAVGFCGRCQYGPSFVCKDGPVLSYARIRSFFWLREV